MDFSGFLTRVWVTQRHWYHQKAYSCLGDNSQKSYTFATPRTIGGGSARESLLSSTCYYLYNNGKSLESLRTFLSFLSLLGFPLEGGALP